MSNGWAGDSAREEVNFCVVFAASEEPRFEKEPRFQMSAFESTLSNSCDCAFLVGVRGQGEGVMA